jgi:Acyltransferase family
MDLVKCANERRPAVPRLDGVDVLRGLSILAVIVLHVYIRLRGYGFKPATGWPRGLFHLVFLNGNNGVTIFFAVSGFLITLTSLRRFGSLAEMRARVFYRIRFARIAPLLLLVLAVLSALCLAHVTGYVISPKVSTLPRALLAALTFHLNYLEAVRGWLPANWDVLWSLSVEEMFYLFFPLVCLALLRFGRGVYLFVALLVAFVVMGPFARTVWAWNDIWQEKSYLGGMDAIALGCLTALLVARLQPAGRRVGFTGARCGDDRADLRVADMASPAEVRGAQRTGRNNSRAGGVSGDLRCDDARNTGTDLDRAVAVVWTAQLRGLYDARVRRCGRSGDLCACTSWAALGLVRGADPADGAAGMGCGKVLF